MQAERSSAGAGGFRNEGCFDSQGAAQFSSGPWTPCQEQGIQRGRVNLFRGLGHFWGVQQDSAACPRHARGRKKAHRCNLHFRENLKDISLIGQLQGGKN